MNSFHFVQTWKQSFRRNSISPIEQAKRFWDNSDSLIQDKDPLSPWSQLTRLMRGQDLSNKKDGKFFTKRSESISSKDKWQNILMNEKRKLDNSKLGSTQQQKICWHWHVARIISPQKIYGLYARKHHIVEMRGDVTNAWRPNDNWR